MTKISAFIVGLIFALGLGIGGMTQPGRVVGFLDIFGNWNPSLLFVMVGALIVHMSLYSLIRKRKTPVFASEFKIPTRTEIDRSLILGSVLFGLGWGLVGYCPAPAMTSIASLKLAPVIFVLSMLSGMVLFNFSKRFKS